MDAERRRKAEALFHEAFQLPPEQWAQFLCERCGDDAALRAEVEALLGCDHTQLDAFLDDPGRERDAQNDTSTSRQPARHAAEQEDLPPQIGPYRCVRRIGRGGMGTVILAVQEDQQFKRRVAIKLLRRGLDTADVLRRFELERQVLGALNHPNIARLLDAGQTAEGRPYFVMEYVEGRPIDDYCDAGNLSVDERLGLFRKVCAAVHFAHQNLVVHRDLKPGNILVTADGEPKLLDFGVAKLLNPDLFQITVSTGPELRLMTPEYASPEQVQGQPISTTSDVYSLGVLLYELLTGQRPYRFATRLQQEVARVICESEPEKPSTAISHIVDVLRRDGTTVHLTPEQVAKARGNAPHRLRRRLSGDLDNIVLKALQKVPRRRYASAEQLAEDLQRHLDGLPVLARPDSRVYRLSKFIRRNRLGVAAAAAIFLALVLGVAGTTWQWRVAADERAQADAARAVAQERAKKLGQLADVFVAQLESEALKVAGATAARKALALTALDAAEKFAAEAGDDPEVLRKLAKVSLLAGDALAGIRTQGEGDITEALTQYQRAHALLKDLAQRDPEDVELQLALAKSLLRLGDVAMNAHRTTESLAYAQEAERTVRGILASGNRDAAVLKRLAAALDDCGDQLQSLRRMTEASASYAEAQRLRSELLAAAPNDPVFLEVVAVSHNKVGKFCEDTGDLEGALRARLAAEEIRQRLVGAQGTADARQRLTLAQLEVGDTLRQLQRLDEAAAKLQAALDSARLLYTDDPVNARDLLILARVEIVHAALQADIAQTSGALEMYTAARQHAEQAAELDTKPAAPKYYAAQARAGLARGTAVKDAAAALPEFRAALQAYGDVLQTKADDLLIRGEWAGCVADYAAALAATGERAPAIEQYELALSTFRELVSRGPLNPEAKKRFDEALARLAALRDEHP